MRYTSSNRQVLTKDEGGLGGVLWSTDLEVVLHEDVQTDILNQQQLLHLGEADGVLAARLAWQQDDGLGHSGTERQLSGILDGSHGVFPFVAVGRLEIFQTQ